MSISYMNINKKKNDAKLSLCKPNLERTKIGNLTDIYDAELILNQGALNELTFTMPVYVERDHQRVKNPLIEKFNGLYFVKCEWNGSTEYFVYTDGNRKLNDAGKEYQYRLISTGHLLSKKIIRSYEEISKPLTWLLIDILKETDWAVGFVDAEFDLMNRSYETTEATVLQAIFEIATKFGALIEWDTVNQKINFMQPELATKNKGFKIREGLTLESLDAEINYDAIVTRLYVYGQDGLEFRRLSPTGSNYIESFDWFMFPFETDSTGKVIKSSRYMSDSLCLAIRAYEKKVADSDPLFKTYITNKTTKQDEIQQREQEWTILNTELKVLLNERDAINATYMDEAPQRADWKQVIANINAKIAQMDAKTAEINQLEVVLASIDAQILALRNDLKVENNYSKNQLKEMNKYIISKTYVNDTIAFEEDLLKDGLKAFKEFNVPPIALNISIGNFLNDFEFEKIKDRIRVGDTVGARIKDFDLDLSMRIIQMKYSFESENINLTVANLKDLRDNWQQFLDKLYSASNTSTTVDLGKNLWDGVSEVESTVDYILNAEYDTAKKVLLGGYHNTVTLTDRGLYSKDIDDPNTYLVLNNAIIAITKDGGNSVEVSISKNGVHANKLVGKIILSKKLWVEDEKGIVEIQSGAINIYNNNHKLLLTLGQYQNPYNNMWTHGLYVRDGSFHIRTSEQSQRGLEMDANGIRLYNNNGVKTLDANAVTGIVSIIGSLNIKTSPDSYKGTVIDGNGIRIYNSSGTVVFNADHYGNIFYAGRLQGATGTVDNLGGTINNMGGTFNGLVTGSLRADIVEAQNIKAGAITTDKLAANSITSDKIVAQSIDANKLNVNDLSAISSNLGNITSGTISIDTDLKVGDNIYLGQRFDQTVKSIIFNNTARINGTWSTLTLGAPNIIVESDRCTFQGVVDFSSATVIGI